MQTFLPHPSFRQSARELDRQRLGKQRVECLQILRALAGETRGWVNHPAVRMWRGYERVLIRYADAVCAEWLGRGYRDTCREKIQAYWDTFPMTANPPKWLGDDAVHRSHRSNLKRKDPEHYGHYTEPSDLEYLWPV